MKVNDIVLKEKENVNNLTIIDADKYSNFKSSIIPDFEVFKTMQLFGGRIDEFVDTDLYNYLKNMKVEHVYTTKLEVEGKQLCIAIKFDQDQLKKMKRIAPLKFVL